MTTEAQSASEEPKRKPYNSPELIEYGTVGQITGFDSNQLSGPIPDGG